MVLLNLFKLFRTGTVIPRSAVAQRVASTPDHRCVVRPGGVQLARVAPAGLREPIKNQVVKDHFFTVLFE